ncbi:hypothetical protein PVAG01_03263 [Phlyctema vagabunda]|uniref:Uncharacterized protein n=1 Tax=Phlyctema vagabunda TaxID=108571 RepID=A0ABR4PTK0_9HELO
MSNDTTLKAAESGLHLSIQSGSQTSSVEKRNRLSFRFFKRKYQTIYEYLEFTRGYKFMLFFLFGGTLFAFSIQRLTYLDIENRFCPAVPSLVGNTGEASMCYWVKNFTQYKVGILLHLATILPACILGVVQFLPIVRHKWLLYHRIAGYIIICLITVSNVGYLLLADIAEGGDLPTQTFLGLLALVVTTMLCLAIYNIKKLQIDQHRNWMLRVFIYMGFVITQRVLLVIIPLILTTWPSIDRQALLSCREIQWLYFGNETMLYTNYPACLPENLIFAPHGKVLVDPKLGSAPDTDRARDAAAFNVAFSTAGFLAIVFHAFIAELYITLTPKTAAMLREVSYRKQSERGWKNAGSAGLVAERLGDSEPWNTPR